MRSRALSQPHLEYRPSGFHWRRRWPRKAVLSNSDRLPRKAILLFPLRTHVFPDAKTTARRLTLLSDLVFAGMTEKTMPIAPDVMDRLLVELCRFQIEAADLAREMAPQRCARTAGYEQACAMAGLETLRQAIHLRDREVARNPLRHVAGILGVPLDEQDPDWQRLAIRALRAMQDAQEENIRRDRGEFGGQSPFLTQALARIDAAPRAGEAIRPWPAAALPHQPMPIRSPDVPAPIPAPAEAGLPVEAGFLSAPPAAAAAPAPAPIPHPEKAAPARRSGGDGPQPRCPTILEATAAYVEARSKGYKTFKPNETASTAAGKSWAANSASNVSSTGRLFAQILGDKPMDQITDKQLKRAWELVERLPHRRGQTQKESDNLWEMANEADARENDIAQAIRAEMKKNGDSPGKIEARVLSERIPRLRAATIYRHMQDLQRICVFMVAKGHLDTNIMADHIWEKAEYERRQILQEDNQRETWCGHTDALFRTPIYQEEQEDPGAPLFWAPLISLHSGLRSEEVLQLACRDIEEIDGIPCFVLQQGPGQSLKSKAARRTVPIHRNLIELGLLQLVELRRRSAEPRLFPWIERSQSKQTFTESFSKLFTRYRQQHRIYDVNRDFHSFRTTFNHRLIESECQDSFRRYLMGHVEHDVGITNYNPNGFSKRTLLNRVNAVVVDVSMIQSPFASRQQGNVSYLTELRGSGGR